MTMETMMTDCRTSMLRTCSTSRFHLKAPSMDFDFEESTGTVSSERMVLFSLSTTQDITFRTFLNGKLVAEGAIETVSELEKALLHTSKLLKCPDAMSSAAMLKEYLTSKLLSQLTTIQSALYNKKCAGMTATAGTRCIHCRYLRKAMLTRISRQRRRHRSSTRTATQKLRLQLCRSTDAFLERC